MPKKTLHKLTVAPLLAVSFLLTSCGAIPAPFEQDVPQTSWSTDADGNKVKVITGASEAKSTPFQVAEAGADFYNSFLSKKGQKKLAPINDLMQSPLAEKAAKSKEAEKELDKKLKEEIETASEIFDRIDYSDMKDKEKGELYGNILVGALVGGGNLVLKVPVQAVNVQKDKATIDMEKVLWETPKGKKIDVANAYNEEDKKKGKNKIHLVRIEGTWKIVGKKFVLDTAQTL